MSFVITAYVREGIVMAADSRLTLTTTENTPLGPVRQSLPQSDANQKLFLSTRSIGISTFGAADINGVPIAGFVQSFMLEQVEGHQDPPEEVAKKLREYLRNLKADLDAFFHVCGFREVAGQQQQDLWAVSVRTNTQSRIAAPDVQGAMWGGEADVMSRLYGQAWRQKPDGSYEEIPKFNLAFQFFTLQDAIDFSVYALRTTIDTLKFLPRAKTVGGPIDVLVIRPNGAAWIQKKELRIKDG
jgi:hypothetical protein